MRPLDPSVPSMREASLAASTSALRELVKRYPMMAFHQVSSWSVRSECKGWECVGTAVDEIAIARR